MTHFVALDDCPDTAAQMVCDTHASKMCVEGVQMLVSGLLNNDAPAHKMPLTKTTGQPHKGGYKNHPATQWASENLSNWIWLYQHTQELCEQFKIRFDKEHFAQQQLRHLAGAVLWIDYIPEGERTPFARCLNQSEGRNLDLLDATKHTAVEAYRIFYMREKAGFACWDKGVPAPHWWNPAGVE
tara:strand:- start:37023 stop:37574 length:552 start_codon:yes stop_codon:yes gene_type:complete